MLLLFRRAAPVPVLVFYITPGFYDLIHTKADPSVRSALCSMFYLEKTCLKKILTKLVLWGVLKDQLSSEIFAPELLAVYVYNSHYQGKHGSLSPWKAFW